jgi:pimeloyl-ACP methyl ester carboxylesterase
MTLLRCLTLRLTTLILLQLTCAFASTAQAAADTANPMPPPQPCSAARPARDDAGFVPIGGIEQWITIKGQDCRNPVLLMVHGGPGDAMSPFADTIYAGWDKVVTLVQWDQRGAGMTYGRQRPSEDTPLTLAQMTADGVAVARYLSQRLGQRQLIVMGSSWGSILSVHMLKAQPELFSAYIGTAQIVRSVDNLRASVDAVTQLAQAAGDQATLSQLDKLGPPPWTNPRSFGALRRATRRYEAQHSTPAPQAWWVPAPAYASAQALADAEASDDYSYLQFVGLTGQGMFSQVDLPQLGLDMTMPFYLVQGEADLVTTPELARRYLAQVRAPAKGFVLVPLAGHDPNPPLVAAQYQVLTELLARLAR